MKIGFIIMMFHQKPENMRVFGDASLRNAGSKQKNVVIIGGLWYVHICLPQLSNKLNGLFPLIKMPFSS